LLVIVGAAVCVPTPEEKKETGGVQPPAKGDAKTPPEGGVTPPAETGAPTPPAEPKKNQSMLSKIWEWWTNLFYHASGIEKKVKFFDEKGVEITSKTNFFHYWWLRFEQHLKSRIETLKKLPGLLGFEGEKKAKVEAEADTVNEEAKEANAGADGTHPPAPKPSATPEGQPKATNEEPKANETKAPGASV